MLFPGDFLTGYPQVICFPVDSSSVTAMYTTYFGLREKPFSIAPDPRYFYMSELHREALAQLLSGISSDGCFILLTGDVGTGKTAICRCLLEQIPDNTDVALIVNPRLTVLEHLKTLCDELKIPLGEGERDLGFYLDSLKDYLRDAHGRGRNTVLLIDEAQCLSVERLLQLILLSKLESDGKKLLKIILVGQAELRQILEKNEFDQLSDCIASRYHLLPLERVDVFAYISHRLAVAGNKEKIFSETALSSIYELSLGVPRLINVLCDRALLRAYEEEKGLVDGENVEQAAKEVFGNGGARREKRSLSSMGMLVFLLFLLAAGAGAVFFYSRLPLPSMLEGERGLAEKREAGSLPLPAEQAIAPPTPASSPRIKEEAREIEQESRKSGKGGAVAEKPGSEERTGATIRIVPLQISD